MRISLKTWNFRPPARKKDWVDPRESRKAFVIHTGRLLRILLTKS